MELKNNTLRGAKILVAMSGGVDSAVAAFLLKEQGFDCAGATFELFESENNKAKQVTGGSLMDELMDDNEKNEAYQAAEQLGIPFYLFNLINPFEKKVMRRFSEGYLHGLTPNPCIDCNRFIKFGEFPARAAALGYEYIATGHYARVEKDPLSGRFVIKKALDENKDQSYVLYTLTQEQLSRVIFPLGNLSKNEVREIAAAQGLKNAQKKESQDICFVPDGNHAGFIACFTGEPCAEGMFIDTEGNILGRHKGLAYYTVGQRKKLGVVLHKPMYVLAKEAANNTVTLGEYNRLFSLSLEAGDFNWIARLPEDGPFHAKAKTRYHQREQSATVTPLDGNRVHIVFDEPQKAIARGQAVVVYDGETVVGGGTIL